MESDALAATLRGRRFRYDSEADLQAGIAIVLEELELPFQKEHRLDGKSRIDFLVDGGTGIEVKVGGSLTALTRQVHRYVQHSEITSLIIVTTKSAHRNMPIKIDWKYIEVVWISGAF